MRGQDEKEIRFWDEIFKYLKSIKCIGKEMNLVCVKHSVGTKITWYFY